MFALQPRKADARPFYLFFSVGSSVCFTLTFAVLLIYQVQTIGLSPLQLVLAGTALELTIFVCEIPTGVIADVYSRRLSIVLGYFLIGISFLLMAFIPSFIGVLLFNILWGFGHTFTSGATEAWITDEVGEDKVGALFLRSSRLSTLFGIGATIVAIVIGSFAITLPMILSGIGFMVITTAMVLYMPETGFDPTPAEERSTFGQMGHTLASGFRLVKVRPTLIAILGIGLFFGLYSEGFDRLGGAHLLTSFTLPDFGGLQPVVYMGILGLIGGFITVLATQVMEKRLDMSKSRLLARASLGLTALLVMFLFGFALAGSFWVAVLLDWGIGVSRALLGPITSTWANQQIDSSVRATVISMTSQVDALGQIVGGPPVGYVGERFGVRIALIAAGMILSPALYLYARVIRSDNRAAAADVPVVAEA
ncbi:MAG: MFS transporter [Chloroflexi bacterium]|nr:MFS transporter [Chloroflexota bacterium]MCC6892748.1 MFS transporter [Anaerolineae bacterium]